MNRADDLGRLREEIATGHHERAEFVANVKETVADMRKENQAENAERTHNVGEMLSGFRDAHTEMAKEQRAMLDANEAERMEEAEKDRAERGEFVDNMKQTVAQMRKENQAENEAAHQAWADTSSVAAVAVQPERKVAKGEKGKSRRR